MTLKNCIMICPPKLVKGSKVAIVSPSGYSNSEFVNSAAQIINKRGYESIIYPSCLNKHFQFGGTDTERLFDLQKALDDEEIDAILCARGGYGAIRIVDKLDFTRFLQKPKWLIGFSDITTLHSALQKIGIMSLHAPMTKDIHLFEDSESINRLFEILDGVFNSYLLPGHLYNRPGETEAEFVGGNISIIYSLQSTPFELDTDGKILFIEDLNEYLYHLDRIMINLKLSGKLKNLKGLIVGAFTDMKDNANPFGKTAYEIIWEHVAEYSFPVCFDFPVGHINNNMPLINGRKYRLSISDNVEIQ